MSRSFVTTDATFWVALVIEWGNVWANDFDCPQSSRNTKAMISLNSRVMQLNWKTGYKEQSYDLSLQCGGFSDGCHGCCYTPQEWGLWLQTSSPSLSVGYMLLFWLYHSICILGSFLCWGILLRLHVVGQDPVVLAAGAGMGVGGGLIFYLVSYLLLYMLHLLGDGST